ncbi:MAG: hypothetical protein H7316_05680 [Tardiphaga sp.]|uniref:hypothetical protein n=1 Tax=Tardiphaga sp. TaxID=1926292 RepID=UPI0019BFE3B9|nr:hypothetical protein [Tardiphaga sp.]MBC7583222.1 hypothetical protein [Tardiphaga sp.]
MKNPYDPALRVQRRAIDAIRLSLLAEIAREQAVAAEAAVLDVRIAREVSVAGSDWQISPHAYVQRQQARRRSLDDEGRTIETALGRLRDGAMTACGQMQAIGGAATAFVAECLRHEMVTEQARADDFAGTRIAAARHQPAFARR